MSIQTQGPLFEAVQQSELFPDSKTFVDTEPTDEPDKIMERYQKSKDSDSFDLHNFIQTWFSLPEDKVILDIEEQPDMESHIRQLWNILEQSPDKAVSEYSTLIPLPHPYIVPGGRFREIYYWDSYFTAEGLAVSGKLDIVKNMALNFAHLIDQIGHVPNGNRTYYVSRSQPPFFASMVDLLVRHQGQEILPDFLPALQKEYDFWMQADSNSDTFRRTVQPDDGIVLNRYWDDKKSAREESYREDVGLAQNAKQRPKEVFRHIRAAAESGWDFSSRWLDEGQSLESIRTTDILPVDLNALLYFYETHLAQWSTGERSQHYQKAAEKRKKCFDDYFWNEAKGFYFDYNWKESKPTGTWSLAAVYPLYFELASPDQAQQVANHLKEQFLFDGGLITTLSETGQQWDKPNGWAPLHWLAVKGLLNYGFDELAHTIAERWLKLNRSVFQRTGKMMEKYNVCDLSLEAGGGEYPLQDGFGWTNGVALALINLFEDN